MVIRVEIPEADTDTNLLCMHLLSRIYSDAFTGKFKNPIDYVI